MAWESDGAFSVRGYCNLCNLSSRIGWQEANSVGKITNDVLGAVQADSHLDLSWLDPRLSAESF